MIRHGADAPTSRSVLRRPLALASAGWLALVLGVSAFPSLVTSVDPIDQNLADRLQGPSARHVFGADLLGRDVFSRLVHSGSDALVSCAIATGVGLVIGVSLGLVAGFRGGLVDAAIQRTAELFFAIPGIIILLIVLALFPSNIPAAMATLGVLLSAGLIRVVRSATLATRQELFVSAARVAGLSDTKIVVRHILPRLTSLVIVQASLMAGVALLVQVGLGFLKFGPPSPAPSWGGLIDEGRQALVAQPWLVVPPGVVVALTVMAFSLLGDAVRDASTAGWSFSHLAPANAAPTRRPHGSAPTPASSRPFVPGTTDALLVIEGLQVEIGDVTVVDGASFSVGRGRTVGLVGESGCGKSVTALSLLGLTPGGGAVTGGHCVFDDIDLLDGGTAVQSLRGHRIGYVSQEPMRSLDPTIRIGRQLDEIVRQHTGRRRRAASQRTRELLEMVGLNDPDTLARRFPHQISGGMAQRVALAYALAGDPDLLIADEPTTALDVTVQADVLALLRRLQQERHMAILLVTHDWGAVAEVCDDAVVMYAGEVVERGVSDDVFAHAVHPYTAALLASNPSTADVGSELVAIPGVVASPDTWGDGCRFADRCQVAIDACHTDPVALEDHAEVAVGHAIRCLRADDFIDTASTVGTTASTVGTTASTVGTITSEVGS